MNFSAVTCIDHVASFRTSVLRIGQGQRDAYPFIAFSILDMLMWSAADNNVICIKLLLIYLLTYLNHLAKSCPFPKFADGGLLPLVL